MISLIFSIGSPELGGTSWAGAQIDLQPVASGIANPVAITHAGDGSGRLFITLQAGQLVIFDGTQVLPTPFLDISSLVLSGGERGLLSVAFHPNYRDNGVFFVYYTNTAGDIVIARYSVSANSNVANPTSAGILLTIPHPNFANHNGGQLQFGPDGYLYIGVGDGGSGGDPSSHGQSLDTFLGKLLRIDVDDSSPYGIPVNNPFVGVPGALPEIWAYGLRNPWRFSFDRSTHDLFIADVGQDSWEEVDFQPASSAGGQNYGWNVMEGNHCFNPPSGCNSTGLTLPILEYAHGPGDSIGCSISGGYRYRGTQNPSLTGIYFYGDFCSGRIWGASEQGGGGWTTTEPVDTALSISSFGEDEAGEIYVADYSQGAIYRILQVNNTASSSGGGGGGGGCFVNSAIAGHLKGRRACLISLSLLLGISSLAHGITGRSKRIRRVRWADGKNQGTTRSH
ncbi:MAG: PQQ-dependent sugar dehydrogenase [Nitrospirota bacterium]